MSDYFNENSTTTDLNNQDGGGTWSLSTNAGGYGNSSKSAIFNNYEIADFFMEKDVIRGGITTVCRTKSIEANNKYMENYNNTNSKFK